MEHSTPAGSRSDDYLVWDIPGNSCSVLLNLDLVDALKKLAKQHPSKDNAEINGILLGRSVGTDSSRTLIAIEDCHPIRERQHFAEHLTYWKTEEPDRLSAVGLIREGAPPGDVSSSDVDLAFFNTHFAGAAAVLIMIVPARRGVPQARLLWSGTGVLDRETEHSEIPLDSARLKAGGFTILRGSPSSGSKPTPADVPGSRHRILAMPRAALRKWAWVPLAAALFAITSVTLWTAYGPTEATPVAVSTDIPIEVAGKGGADRETKAVEQRVDPKPVVPTEPLPVREPDRQPIRERGPVPPKPVDPQPQTTASSAALEVTTKQAAVPEPVAVPETQAGAAEPKPVDTPPPPPPPRVDHPRRVIPATVSFEFHPAPESVARKLVNRVPGLPLLRHFQTKEAEDFVPPAPVRQAKPAVPAETVRDFPGEWRVDLRVTVDKSGQVSHAALLSPNANREFVNLAKEAIDHWEFEPARLHNRPVSSALDITVRFRNPVPTQSERAAR